MPSAARVVLCALPLAATVAAAGPAVHEARQALIREINESPGVLWRAAASPRFASQALGASKSLCGLLPGWKGRLEAAVSNGHVQRFVGSDDAAIPEAFDAETNWPQCAKVIGEIRDQSNCGCCWAFGAAEAASDRMCIATNGSISVPLSAQDVCFCASKNGCGGGDTDTPWSYIKETGAVSGGQYQGTGPFGAGLCSDFSLPHCHHHGPQGSDPYPSDGAVGCPSEKSPACPSACDTTASSAHGSFLADKYSFKGEVVTAKGEQQMQQMLMAGGPMEVSMDVWEDFENYAGGIYHHVKGQWMGGHAVKLVGWGVENGAKYWKVANSWNPYWGEHGYFRIKRGDDECSIEGVGGTAASSTAVWGKKSGLPAKAAGAFVV